MIKNVIEYAAAFRELGKLKIDHGKYLKYKQLIEAIAEYENTHYPDIIEKALNSLTATASGPVKRQRQRLSNYDS